MPQIEYLGQHVVYENPKPHVRSRHGYFPGLVQLPTGELLGLFVLGEAFESPNLATYVTRSLDFGRTWQLQGPLYDKSHEKLVSSEFMKPQILRDGSLMALGYRFYRPDPEAPIADPKTDGCLSGDEVVSFSSDEGRTWTVPKVFPHSTPELVEIPSRCLQLQSGDIVVTGGLFKMPDGTNPSGQFGVLLRSRDNGKSWDDTTRFISSPNRTITAYESHVCEMQPGRLVAICWAFDIRTGKQLPNQVVVSHDHGYTWSDPIDTGHMGQASNLMSLGGERLVSVHCHRGEKVGLYARIIDFTNDQWKVLHETVIWGASSTQRNTDGQQFHVIAKALRFGQASLLRLNNGEVLVTHWTVEEGQGKILAHRLRLKD
ncbi:MAG: exo-alpha-sialidase [Lacunisphaera sp.]|nr:exo-alpha-sialidase [Lacunisphaera sp.]